MEIGTVSPNDSSGEVTGFADSGVSVDNNSQFALGIGKFLNDKLAIQLLLATPFSHSISGEGSLAGLV